METLKKIRELRNGKYRALPVIALTANTVSGAREMFRSEGFTEFVPKPIERTVLERVLRKVLPKSCIQYNQRPVNEEPEGPEAPEDTEAFPAEGIEASAADARPETAFEGIPYDRLSQAGVNTELGLDYCAGDEDFYREMLRMFCAQGGEKRAEIISLYESANWADYAVKVHALKSTSLTIGAEAFSAQAKELEMAGKQGDTGYIQAHHAALMEAHEALCGHIAGLLPASC